MNYPLEDQIQRFEELLNAPDQVNPAISASGIYWHIDHCLRVIMGVSLQIQRSKAEDYSWSFNIARTITLIRGDFPRGRAEAPKRVVNPGEVHKDEILKLIQKAKTHLKAFDGLHAKQHFDHHLFGKLKKSKAKKFLRIHTHHHLLIIDDIIASL